MAGDPYCKQKMTYLGKKNQFNPLPHPPKKQQTNTKQKQPTKQTDNITNKILAKTLAREYLKKKSVVTFRA